MLRPIDQYFLKQEEPLKSTLIYLRDYIIACDKTFREKWEYSMPFYYYGDKRICYLWVHKKWNQPYLGIVEGNRNLHPDLIAEKRAKMKILLLDPFQDLPLSKIRDILGTAISFYK